MPWRNERNIKSGGDGATLHRLFPLFRIHEERFQRLENDRPVEDRRAIFKIVDVVLQFLNDILVGPVGAVVDLRPAGNTGFYEEACFIIRDACAELFHEFGALGPRADERDVAADDVPELGELV